MGLQNPQTGHILSRGDENEQEQEQELREADEERRWEEEVRNEIGREYWDVLVLLKW